MIIREKIPFKCEIITCWRIETIEMQLCIGFFLEVFENISWFWNRNRSYDGEVTISM